MFVEISIGVLFQLVEHVTFAYIHVTFNCIIGYLLRLHSFLWF